MKLTKNGQALKRTVTILMIAILLYSSIIPTFASEAMPAYEACFFCSLGFGIYDGVAEVIVDYAGHSTTFVQIDIEVKIQKRVLGVFWQRVDIGTEDNYWRYTSTELQDILRPRFSIEDEAGTYRAVFYIRFSGTTGVDEIEDKIQYTYS